MNTSLTLFDRTIELYRYPENTQNKSLQAWDAADEYLIDYITNELEESLLDGMQIFNDDFGALTCWFHQCAPHSYSDSYVAQQGCRSNLNRNNLSIEHIHLDNSMQNPQAAKLVIIKIPRTTALLEHQLLSLQSVVTPETKIIAAGKSKDIHNSTLALFEKYLGATTTSLAKKKARLIFCSPLADKAHASPYPTVWKLENTTFSISNYANVFARQQLDIGARFMLDNLPDAHNQSLVDLGCGNGVLGLSVLARNPSARVIFVDESHMAVASARKNIEDNLPQLLENCEFIVSNCLDNATAKNVDLVLCNPPFHQQNTITDHIAWQMFKDSKRILRKHGELRIVGNRHLDYPAKLKRLFGGYSVVASNKKFSILSAFAP